MPATRPTFRSAAPLLLLAAACAQPAPPAPPVQPTASFSYQPNPAVMYSIADSADFEMQFGNIGFGSQAVARVELAPVDSGIRLTATLTDFDGSFTGPTGRTTATEAGARGAFVWTLSPAGRIIDSKLPTMTEEFEQVARSGDMLRALIIPLPRGPVTRGTSWTDTIVTREERETKVDNTTIVTSTWSRDSTIAGTEYRVIESTMQNQLSVEGQNNGMTVKQRLTGQTLSTALWDPARGILVSRISRGELNGTLDVVEAGMTGVPIKARIRSRVEARP